jgi:hypothetical protein
MGAEEYAPAAHVPSFLHPAGRTCGGRYDGPRNTEVWPSSRGGGSTAAKTRSKGRPVFLPPRPYRGSKPAGGWFHSGKDPKQGAARVLTAAALQGQ